MAISEAQLETWASQGKTGQFTATYQAIRANLLDRAAPYPVGQCEVFLQGSYGNDTNVHGDSDVDIVLKHHETFYSNIDALAPEDRDAYRSAFKGDAQYAYDRFHPDALGWIQKLYNGASAGRKAVLVPGTTNRREADILIAHQFRRYHEFKTLQQSRYTQGICFFSGGRLIENFPKQHAENCTRKHQITKSRFKPMVRIFKNMRNSMIVKGYLQQGIAPSYFIEGMLFNVPGENFSGTYVDAWVHCFNWVVKADRAKLV